MGTGKTDNPLLPLEAEDPRIEACLSTLTAQWPAWLEAMQKAQLSLQAGCARCADSAGKCDDPPADSAISAREKPVDAPTIAKATSASGTFVLDARAQSLIPSDTAEPSNGATGHDTDDDDKALLASLDEATADAIRVQRRLGNKDRSVRELLDSMKPIEPSDDEPQQSKKWWKRSNS